MNPSDTLRFALHDRIDGAEIKPSHIPLALLGQFRNEVEEFLKGSGKEVDPAQVFVAIEEGSLALAVAGLLAASSLWNDMTQLQNPSALGSIDPKRAAVVMRWQEAARKNPNRSYALADKNNHLTLRVDSRSNFYNWTEEIWTTVEKYLQGTVMDLGGATNPNIHLKQAAGKGFIIAASQKLLAEQEKNHLYHQVLLRVSAEENLRTGELRNFNLLAFENLQPVWDEAEFNRMVEKGTQAWADVPDEWLEELRGGRG